MKIGMTYDLKEDWRLKEGDPVDANAEFDKAETVDFIAQALRSGGHQVKKIGNVESLLKQVDRLDADIVFNICEGRYGRNRESQVPVILESKGIPFVGSDGLTLGITLDKVVAKKCFVADGVPTPRFLVASSAKDLKGWEKMKFPLFVKASCEGTSKSLTKESRVENYEQLKKRVEWVAKTYKQPALVEEFIRGKEFTVPVLGNADPQAMPVIQVSIDGSLDLGDKFYEYERLFSDDLRYVCPAEISEELNRKLQDVAVRAYKSVGCRDFGRVDFRVDEQGNPFVLEINPLPSLGTKDAFNLFPQALGTTYEVMINQILNLALQRYGMAPKQDLLPHFRTMSKVTV